MSDGYQDPYDPTSPCVYLWNVTIEDLVVVSRGEYFMNTKALYAVASFCIDNAITSSSSLPNILTSCDGGVDWERR